MYQVRRHNLDNSVLYSKEEKIDFTFILNFDSLTLRLSTQNGIRQQPNQPPSKRIPPQISQATKPVVFSTRVIID